MDTRLNGFSNKEPSVSNPSGNAIEFCDTLFSQRGEEISTCIINSLTSQFSGNSCAYLSISDCFSKEVPLSESSDKECLREFSKRVRMFLKNSKYSTLGDFHTDKTITVCKSRIGCVFNHPLNSSFYQQVLYALVLIIDVISIVCLWFYFKSL